MTGIADQVAARLAPYIGELNAQMWVKAVARRAFSLPPESLAAEHVATLVDGLRPSLATLMGRNATDELLQHIQREVR